MVTKIKNWGNSLGLRLPKKLTKKLNLTDGSEIEVREVDGGLLIRPYKVEKLNPERST